MGTNANFKSAKCRIIIISKKTGRQINELFIEKQQHRLPYDHTNKNIVMKCPLPQKEMRNWSDPPFCPSARNLPMVPLAGGILPGLEQCDPGGWMSSVSTSSGENEHTAKQVEHK